MYLHLVHGLALLYLISMLTIKYLHPLSDLELTKVNASKAYALIPKYEKNF